MSIVRTCGTDGCVNWSSIDPISRVVVRPQSCGVASLRSGNIHVADRGFGKAYDSSPFENKMAAIGSYPERLLLVIVLCGATSIVPPRRRVAVGSVIAKLDNSGMFL